MVVERRNHWTFNVQSILTVTICTWIKEFLVLRGLKQRGQLNSLELSKSVSAKTKSALDTIKVALKIQTKSVLSPSHSPTSPENHRNWQGSSIFLKWKQRNEKSTFIYDYLEQTNPFFLWMFPAISFLLCTFFYFNMAKHFHSFPSFNFSQTELKVREKSSCESICFIFTFSCAF